MNSPFIDIIFEGDQFSPRRLKEMTGLPLYSLAEYDEVANRGRYKGKKFPFGLALLKVARTPFENLNKVLESALNYLFRERVALKESGVKEISIDREDFNGNLIEVDQKLISRLLELNKEIKISEAEFYEKSQIVDPYKIVYFLDSNILEDFYNSLLSHNAFLKGLSSDKENKLKYLLSKTLEYNLTNIKISHADLITAVILYLIKYMEEDPDRIPPFEKILREKQLL